MVVSDLINIKNCFDSMGLNGVRCFLVPNFKSMPTLILDFPDEHSWALPQLERAFLGQGIFVSGYAEFTRGYFVPEKRHMVMLNKALN